jgi:hypothetical protein
MEHLSYFQYGRGKLNKHLRRAISFSRAVHGIEAVSSLRSVHGKRKGNNGAGTAAWFAFEPNLPWHRNTMAPEIATTIIYVWNR